MLLRSGAGFDCGVGKTRAIAETEMGGLYREAHLLL
jgi:hypothetical protein